MAAAVSPLTQFFKCLATGCTKRLRLPPAFCRNLSEKKPKTALIKSCLGYWDVKVGRSGDGKLAFEEGWEEFAKRNGLKEEDIVVSEHKGDMVFNAVAYDSGGCEKKYPPDSGVAANRMATSSKARSNKHHRGSKGKGLLKTTKWLTSAKLFKIKMAKTHGCVSKAYVTIPARFARENGLHSISKLILNDPRGRLWPVSLGRWGSRVKAVDHRLAINTKGWYKFYASNSLKEGEVCLFKLKRMSRSISTAFMDVEITPRRSESAVGFEVF
ncbi:B3 domain-containing protein REM8-like [Pyrus x bretschneideri]|uniref:B3 domain-containing protein REM8-like n=1 Tax=Pyrus x bretschneideri TaxID=225117 RepID=UPI00202E8216|nr:B3 domain-containing protein REM8-like [Pyrus x bretschneideri]XP_048444328.1 B3 domain-containing protein REM8-like [Pyrus x bretschneideri]